MGAKEVGDDVVALAKAGQFDAIGEKYWADDVVSIESAPSPMQHCSGIDAVRAKTEWWNGAHEVHGGGAHGPYVNGDQFAVRFEMDVTVKESGQRFQMDEVAIYTVRDDKIVEERFFY